MRTTVGWQSTDHSPALRRTEFDRRDLRDDDIAVRVDYCGVCHSDLHRIRGVFRDEGALVPGHEFTGTVTATGSAVTAFTPGDRVAVGTVVDSCGECAMCRAGQENYCHQGATSTYGGTDRIDGTPTRGGYSREYVLRDRFAYRLPEALDAATAAPLLCAGITMWEPMRAAGVGPGSRVAIAGLGGLGHLGVKFAAALGAEVTVLSRTPDKAADACRLGATDLLVSTDDDQLAAACGRFDLVLDTISAPHEVPPLLRLLALDGTLCVVGWPGSIPLQVMDLIYGRKKLTASGTGGRAGTAEMLAFAAEHGIGADIELLPSARVEEALTRLDRGDVRYRFVLDLADLDT
ncbi:NADP-dependent alcohol dehydrogenase [Actinocatenispora thailandica]|uniref:alcohol dehydrogenase (NADP(+)) n=1 Tax=Actinocatenispora thailandica TaxID=227318 RepID=A0A7R7HYD3_9ACTN|nr:NAD(P)-dependent alcohol dehydrogenase [Actinocatenispora thailandica]BCJ37008.1 NADP-dependent alcohol dehydrogenase [Actinocatenispora thailandica]